jgi:hypothetical protein
MNHATRISEGHESARRILKHTPLTSDPLLLHRVDTSQLGDRDGVSVGGCCPSDYSEPRVFQQSRQALEDAEQMAAIREWRECHNIEFAENAPYNAKSLALAVAVVGAIGLLVWHLSPELRGLFSILTY